MSYNLQSELAQPQLQKEVSTAMPNNLQVELAQPQPQKGVRAKCSTAAFPKMFTCRE
jgi:hypothetical protein